MFGMGPSATWNPSLSQGPPTWCQDLMTRVSLPFVLEAPSFVGLVLALPEHPHALRRAKALELARSRQERDPTLPLVVVDLEKGDSAAELRNRLKPLFPALEDLTEVNEPAGSGEDKGENSETESEEEVESETVDARTWHLYSVTFDSNGSLCVACVHEGDAPQLTWLQNSHNCLLFDDGRSLILWQGKDAAPNLVEATRRTGVQVGAVNCRRGSDPLFSVSVGLLLGITWGTMMWSALPLMFSLTIPTAGLGILSAAR